MNIETLIANLRLLIIFTVLLVGAGLLILFISGASPEYLKVEVEKPNNWRVKDINTDLPDGKEGKLIRYGYLLVTESPAWMGPMAKNENMRYAGNNLSCKNCHLMAGTQMGSASFIGVVDRFPQWRNRENKFGTIEERINGCMERSMNGKKLPENSRTMKAIVAYMDWLGDGLPKGKVSSYKGFPKIKIPNYPASPEKGKLVYEKECLRCHGDDGQGMWLPDSTKGYLYPPLWGGDTYNHGAGMHRVITAAQFIKGNMPYGEATAGNPKLSDEQAYHVAAYINSFNRPKKVNPEADFPNKRLKPLSTPYGPWEDEFTEQQHKYGPFPPMMEYYKENYGIKKSK